MNRELTTLEIWLVIALLLCGVVLFSGCSAHQQMYVGQSLDIATTYYALEVREGYRELNPLADNMRAVLVMKALFLGFVELMAYWFPQHADVYYTIGAIGGYIPATINTVRVIK